jgi:holin-like protein
MIHGFLIILGFQLIGELLVVLLGLPLPGPVLGLVFLLAGLLVLGRIPEPVRNVSSGLLSNLSLLFVPAGVGLVLHFDLLAEEWWIILLALLLSTLLAALVTALMFRWLMKAVKG